MHNDVKNQMTQSEVRSLFEYRDGKLFWKVSRGKAKQSDRAGCDVGDGYWRIGFKERSYREHNLVWNYFNGLIPKGVTVDHVKYGIGNRSGNFIESLRLANASEQQRNCGLSKGNKSGHRGVSWQQGRGKWMVTIGCNGRNINCGTFVELEDAIRARKGAEEKYWNTGKRGQL